MKLAYRSAFRKQVIYTPLISPFRSIAAFATSSPFRIPFQYDGEGSLVVGVAFESAEDGRTGRTEQVRITPDSMSYILNVPESRATFIAGGWGFEPELLNITTDPWLYRLTRGPSSLPSERGTLQLIILDTIKK